MRFLPRLPAFVLPVLLSLCVSVEATPAPADLENRVLDVVVIGATPGGLATAIRASREGLTVLVVNHTGHIGGMLSTGLGVLDTEFYRTRSPILDEMCARLKARHKGEAFSTETFVREHPGERLRYEPHVIEDILNRMVAAEEITVLLGYYPSAIRKQGKRIRAVRLQSTEGEESLLVAGRYFVDATYEGDLAALAGVPYRVGRESADEYGEPSAGVHFSYLVDTEERPEAVRDLGISKFRVSSRRIPHPRDGEGDNAIQAYNFRPTLSNDPANRFLPPKPEDYDPEAYQLIRERLSPLPDTSAEPGETKLVGWNVAILPGGNHDYPNGSWEVRRRIERKHRDWLIGILHFLQRDMPEPVWGLAKDEFVDNGHMPYEMYVREARRIVGLKVFTELDGLLSRDFNRAPLHEGSIAITEWAIDSHGCTTDRYLNSRPEGKVLLSEDSVPGQVDFKCLLSPEATNLVVPVCLSSTHVGWGTIRLEPTWMQIGESAGFALAMARDRDVDPINLDIDSLQRLLANERILLTYFDDLDVTQPDPHVPAFQYFGAKGFFPTYKARADHPLTRHTARIWLETTGLIRQGIPFDPNAVAARIATGGTEEADRTISREALIVLAGEIDGALATALAGVPMGDGPDQPISRAEVAYALFTSLDQGEPR